MRSFEISEKILCIPASSAAIECVFPRGKRRILDFRTFSRLLDFENLKIQLGYPLADDEISSSSICYM